jgi:hypothetical protein
VRGQTGVPVIRLRRACNIRSRPKAHLAVAFVAVANHLSVVGLAAAPAVATVAVHTSAPAVSCSDASYIPGQCQPFADATLELSLPSGTQQCPLSGAGAACSLSGGPAVTPSPGVASMPDGQTPCSAEAASPLISVGACSNALLPTTQPSKPTSAAPRVVEPSVPLSSLQPAPAVQRLNLSAGASNVRPGQNVVLTATAGASVTGTGSAIEIFDQTTGTGVAACSQGSQCAVAYAARSGLHKFVAFITAPTPTMPAGGSLTSSNQVSVNWIGVALEAKDAVVGPGNAVTVTATANTASGSGYMLQLFDADSKSRLTFCAQGNSCSIALTQTSAGTRSVVAALAAPSPTYPARDVQAQSDPVALTWLAASIVASSTYQIGANVFLTATANVDLTNTPWSLGILDDQGRLVGQPCKSGTTCAAQAALGSGATPTYSAVIGTVPSVANQGKLGQVLQRFVGPSALVNIQAHSSPIKPKRLLWGVDSCKSFTENGLYPQIAGILGTPEFWGRYLTDAVCPPLSATEVSAAHAMHMGILPIYNERDCSNVSGYDTGRQYAAEAVGAARAIGLPAGRGIAIDIEPSGPACPGAAFLDTGLIHGWYDGITEAHYAPIYYGNGTAGSEFATQWCYTVSALPYIGETSYLWSFQPSLLGGYMKSNAPGFAPNRTGCVGYVHAWQYQIGSSSWAAPDVDGDEATSELPLWFP